MKRSLRKHVINIEIFKMIAKMWRKINSISKCERTLEKITSKYSKSNLHRNKKIPSNLEHFLE